MDAIGLDDMAPDTTGVAFADQVRSVLGWTPRYDDLDTIVRTALAWEKKIAAKDPSAYWRNGS